MYITRCAGALIFCFLGCSDPPMTITVDCRRAALVDGSGMNIDCGNNGNETVTYYGPTSPNVSNGQGGGGGYDGSCSDATDCLGYPVKCTGTIHCIYQVCTCSARECFTNEECEDPIGTCRIALCDNGTCGETWAEDGDPCMSAFGHCEMGTCKPNQPQP